jgi:CRISPR/Cas system-associated exonuclease Cas4 (RecB family)
MTATLMSPRAAPAALPSDSYLSYSRISLYQSCPLRYFFKYVAGLPERTVSASLVFGSAVHRAAQFHFEELLAGNEPPCLDALIAEYDRHWQEVNPQLVQFGKDDDIESLGGLVSRMLAAFQASTVAKPVGQIIGIEEQLRGKVIDGCPDLLGRLDLLVETDDALVVTDLKTSRSRWSSEQVDDQSAQLLLYSQLVSRLAPGKRLRLQFAVITKTKEPAVDVHEVVYDQRRVERTKRVVEHVWRAIEGEHFYPAPSPLQCPSCAFRDACRAWKG